MYLHHSLVYQEYWREMFTECLDKGKEQNLSKLLELYGTWCASDHLSLFWNGLLYTSQVFLFGTVARYIMVIYHCFQQNLLLIWCQKWVLFSSPLTLLMHYKWDLKVLITFFLYPLDFYGKSSGTKCFRELSVLWFLLSSCWVLQSSGWVVELTAHGGYDE